MITSFEVVGDFLTSVGGVCAAYMVASTIHGHGRMQLPAGEMTAVAFIVSTLIVVLMEIDGAYRGGSSLLRIRETERTVRIPWQALLLVLPITFFMGRSFSRGSFLLALVSVPAFLILQKYLFAYLLGALHMRGYGVRRVAIYGAGHTGKRVFSALCRSRKLGLSPVVVIDDDERRSGETLFELAYRRLRSVSIEHGPVTAEGLKARGCEVLVIAIPNLSRDKFPQAMLAAMQANVEVAFLPNWATTDDQWTGSIDIDGLLLTSAGKVTTSLRYGLAKRAFDLAGSLLLLLFLSPILLVIALAVRMDSAGPIFFKQKRVGKDGRLFTMYKFRSMRTDAPVYGDSPKDSVDPRITRVGRFLRKTSLDETVQLLNVLRGEMSLVGPRPEMPFIVDRYDQRQRQRLQVLPGITGLWQLSADREHHIHENLQYDLYYIRNRGFFLDLAVLIHTAIFAMRGV